ncbi:hypothetical protein FQN60_006139 [Etheostoma spectabile]|uniref:Uncharacterized protein n=1 Tax=Etheostoma spectabile TaxID=54343 RepID=A0A5J5CKK0_9PERO|nr:hypothetical protein FQN60_006139 [Etheostoma spectabile]
MLLVLCAENIKTGSCWRFAGRCRPPGAYGCRLRDPCFPNDPRGGVHEPELPGFALLLSLLPPQCHLRGHHPLPLRYQSALCAHAVSPATETLVAFQRGNNAVVSASGALRGAGVTPLQHGVTTPEDEMRRAQEGMRHLQTAERVGVVPGQAKRSDPAVHCLNSCKHNVLKSNTVIQVLSQVMWPSLSDWRLCNAGGTLNQRALSVSSPERRDYQAWVQFEYGGFT